MTVFEIVAHRNVDNWIRLLYENCAHKFIRQKSRKLHKFATTSSIFFKSIVLDMHHHKTYMYINFQQIPVSIDQLKLCTQIYLQKMTSCINLQLPIVIFKKSIISDMRHRKTYMYIDF